MVRVFSQKHSLTFVGNVGTESVYQIVQSGRTECFVGVSRGCLARRLYSQDTRETQLSPSVLTLHIPVMCKAHASLRGMLSRELPTRNLLASIA